MDRDIVRRGMDLLEGARERGFRVAVAESCTGGLLSTYLTAEGGASLGFAHGVIVYDVASKGRLLGISAGVVRRFGVVSEEVARRMVLGLFRGVGGGGLLGISVTGVAGPEGVGGCGVGCVYIGVGLGGGGDVWVSAHRFEGNRGEVRRRCVGAALEEALRLLERTRTAE